jgi:hypothetical protein
MAVGETTRRARYWNSRGPRLDQGAEGAAVGFAWAIWATDRGVRLADGAFDEAWARALYGESQKLAGIDDAAGGSYVWAGERALRDRGLIAESFACPDRDSIVAALLERGLLIAGVTWMVGMDEPVWVNGRCVCRVEKDTPRGGHAIVLNGVDLDLEIDGVRGFVRFKNSWGALWGDDGQALISLDDLERIVQFDSVLLPIPPSDVLGPGSNSEVADPETPPGGYGPQSIGSDLWTTHDTVGYAAYAEAIARGIQHEDTTPPLTIGIKAPWGAGKTSLMRMIADRLEWPSGKRSNDPRPLHLVDSQADKEVTNRAVLERAQSETPKRLRATLESEEQDDDERRWRATVWFNPWMYQTGEQVWAGLAHEIITQITGRMSRVERERFWLELNIRRVDEQAVRRRIYALVLEKLVPWAIAGAVVVVVGLALLAVNAVAGALTVAAGPAGVGILGAVRRSQVLGERPTGSLAKLVTPVTEELIQSPDYAAQTGFFYLLQTDLQRVLDLVATPRRPLVVFVDDLDRCSPGTVVQVIEAINLFLAGQYPNCIFVIAMEPDMVAAHVETAYGPLAERLKQSGADFDLGWRFLEKIVQLPLTLPALEPERAAGFAESLLTAREPEAESPLNEEDVNAAVAAAGEQLRDAALSGVVEMAAAVAPRGAEAEAVRRAVARRLSIEDAEVKRAIKYAAAYLDANPREIKRFVNVFRFLVMIHTERSIEGLTTTASLEQLAKLALVSTRWPELMSTLARPSGAETIFELLEQSEDESVRATLIAARVSDKYVERLLGDRLGPILRAEPTVGSAARHYL